MLLRHFCFEKERRFLGFLKVCRQYLHFQRTLHFNGDTASITSYHKRCPSRIILNIDINTRNTQHGICFRQITERTNPMQYRPSFLLINQPQPSRNDYIIHTGCQRMISGDVEYKISALR